jgi:hypothetical protein
LGKVLENSLKTWIIHRDGNRRSEQGIMHHAREQCKEAGLDPSLITLGWFRSFKERTKDDIAWGTLSAAESKHNIIPNFDEAERFVNSHREENLDEEDMQAYNDGLFLAWDETGLFENLLPMLKPALVHYL